MQQEQCATDTNRIGSASRPRVALGALPEVQNRPLPASMSLPDMLTRRRPPSRVPPLGRNLPGHNGLSRILEQLTTFTKTEMQIRGVPRRGTHSEARLDVWREALASFSRSLPSSQAFLSQVMAEFDGAIAALVAEVRECEAKLSAAYIAGQRAEERAGAAKRDAEKLVKGVVKRRQEEETELKAFNEARARPQLTAEATLSAIFELAEPQRLECIGRAVEKLSDARRRYLLLRWLRKLQAAERSAIFAMLLSTARGNHTATGMAALEGDGTSRSNSLHVNEELDGDAVEALLDAMPERLRKALSEQCLRSLSEPARNELLNAMVPRARP